MGKVTDQFGSEDSRKQQTLSEQTWKWDLTTPGFQQ